MDNEHPIKKWSISWTKIKIAFNPKRLLNAFFSALRTQIASFAVLPICALLIAVDTTFLGGKFNEFSEKYSPSLFGLDKIQKESKRAAEQAEITRKLIMEIEKNRELSAILAQLELQKQTEHLNAMRSIDEKRRQEEEDIKQKEIERKARDKKIEDDDAREEQASLVVARNLAVQPKSAFNFLNNISSFRRRFVAVEGWFEFCRRSGRYDSLVWVDVPGRIHRFEVMGIHDNIMENYSIVRRIEQFSSEKTFRYGRVIIAVSQSGSANIFEIVNLKSTEYFRPDCHNK
mgnify:CR=1 FL=1